MTTRDIAHHRLVNQNIASARCSEPGEVAAALGAMQAQDCLGALWAIGLRLTDATNTVVERAIAERKIIRTWPMRSTLHFVAAADVRWMLELLTPRSPAVRAVGRNSNSITPSSPAAGNCSSGPCGGIGN